MHMTICTLSDQVFVLMNKDENELLPHMKNVLCTILTDAILLSDEATTFLSFLFFVSSPKHTILVHILGGDK